MKNAATMARLTKELDKMVRAPKRGLTNDMAMAGTSTRHDISTKSASMVLK